MTTNEADELTPEEDLAARQLLARFAHALDDVELHAELDHTRFFDADAELVVGGQAVRGAELGAFLGSLKPGGLHLVSNIVLSKDAATGRVHGLSHFGFFQRQDAGWQLVAGGSYVDVLEVRGRHAVFLRREVRVA